MSAPPTPPSEMPRFGNSRFKPMATPCEHVDSYRPGGFHPVHLGDVLCDRYRVIRKLGYGSFATVWLAVDSISSNCVALKVHAANVDVSNELSINQHLVDNASRNPNSKFVLLTSDTFIIHGPNGKHHCFVTNPMGPSISTVLNAPHKYYDPLNPPTHRFSTPRNKNILRNILAGLDFLHSNDIVHGDLQSGNLLFSLKELAKLDPEKLLQNEANSQLDPITRIDGKVDRWSPRYLAVPEPLTHDVLPNDQPSLNGQETIKIADFGGAFWVGKPPKSIVTPVALRAPEVIFHNHGSPASDIWSFGCLMYALLTECPLFQVSDFGQQPDLIDDEHLIEISEVIGPLPDYMRADWPRYSTYFGPSGERLTAMPRDFDESEMGRRLRSIAIRKNLAPPKPAPPLKEDFFSLKPNDVDDVEAEEIVALLKDILQLDPQTRPSAGALLTNSWFST
ncbi:serine/threonine-protein kinase SRPK3 [Xylaria telfairii]|nr:serine/threonine-protein kinase SRPK3 [Xylaria telfairii]